MESCHVGEQEVTSTTQSFGTTHVTQMLGYVTCGMPMLGDSVEKGLGKNEGDGGMSGMSGMETEETFPEDLSIVQRNTVRVSSESETDQSGAYYSSRNTPERQFEEYSSPMDSSILDSPESIGYPPSETTISAANLLVAHTGEKEDKEVINQCPVIIAKSDYFQELGLEEYFKRCKKLRIKNFNKDTRQCLTRMWKEVEMHAVPRPQMMSMYMNKTFSLRNQDLLYHGLSIRNAVAIYPGLRDFGQLREEFQRVTGKCVEEFDSNLKRVLKHFFKQQVDRNDCPRELCGMALNPAQYGIPENRVQKAASRIIVYSCAQTMRKWENVIFHVITKGTEQVFTSANVPRLQPFVVVRQNPFLDNCADVYCEKVKILASVGFLKAILACYYCYYVFNLNYPTIDEDLFKPFDDILHMTKPAKRVERR